MSVTQLPRTGARILVDQLVIHGVDTIFCVPGESYLGVLDALYDQVDSVRLIACRQEGGAAYMAEAYGKLTGRPGICFVSRGPGATNASIGVHTAHQDSTPLLLFIGQVARPHLGREAFQEIDYRQMYSPLAKWVFQIDDPARLPEVIGRAFQLAVSGRPGPVVLVLPEDMLAEACVAVDASRYQRVQPAPTDNQLAALIKLLNSAERPLMIVGGSDWTADAVADIRVFAENHTIPVATAFRAQDIFDNRSPCYAGTVGVATDPALIQRIGECDLLLVIGDRLSDIVTGSYTLLENPRPRQTLIHVYPDPAEINRVYQATLPILSGMPEFAQAVRHLAALNNTRWASWTAQAHDGYLAYLQQSTLPVEDLDLAAVMTYLRGRLPEDAIITNGAGNYTQWVHRFYQFSTYRTQLGPTSGAMGYGVPAAIAAKALHPQRIVVAFAGDGCFLMNGQELATAIQHGINVIILVINNGMFGTIRMHQERHHPGRVIGTTLTNPDFAAYAAAFGAHGEVVQHTAEFAPAFERALNAGRPALLELRLSGNVLTPTMTVGSMHG